MPNYDRQCANGHQQLDCWEPMTNPGDPACPTCALPLVRTLLGGQTNAVKDDSIPGGLWIRNGLCHPDGTPRRYDSWTEIHREAKRLGLEPKVNHVTDPRTGSDKSTFTTRWFSADLTNFDDPAVQLHRKQAMAAWLGVTLDEFERIRNPPPQDLLPMDEVEFAIRHEVSQHRLVGHLNDD